MQSGLSDLLFAIAVIAFFLLAAGGVRLIRMGERTKGILMIVAAVVLLGNILIWSWTPAH